MDETTTTALRSGTYARETDGAGHMYHSETRWNDPVYGLMRYVRRESTSSLYEWRQVTDERELAAVYAYLCGNLRQGEYVEVSADDVTHADRLERAAAAGVDAGTAAGSWYFNGAVERDDARRVLQGLEDGDPAIMDTLPSSPLSGEWADGVLPRDVLEALGVDEDDDGADDYLRAFEGGFSDGAYREVERVARLHAGTIGDGGGITPEGQALGHRYVMGNVNAYCPKCSDERGVCVLDCDYDLDK